MQAKTLYETKHVSVEKSVVRALLLTKQLEVISSPAGWVCQEVKIVLFFFSKAVSKQNWPG